MNTKREVVTLCGSTRFKKEFIDIAKNLTLQGKIVFSFSVFKEDYSALTAEQKAILTEVHKGMIDLCDTLFVVNAEGYIGESTRKEIEYAEKQGKKISYYSRGNHGH